MIKIQVIGRIFMHIHMLTLVLIQIRCNPEHRNHFPWNYARCSSSKWLLRFGDNRTLAFYRSSVTKPAGKMTEISQTHTPYSEFAEKLVQSKMQFFSSICLPEDSLFLLSDSDSPAPLVYFFVRKKIVYADTKKTKSYNFKSNPL